MTKPTNNGRHRRATQKDVASAVGVHVSTVSRALDERTRHMLTPDIVRRVLEASDRLSYRPNHAAKSLRTNRTGIVGVIVPDITNPLFPPIIRGVEDGLATFDYAAIIANTEGGLQREASVLEMLHNRGVDGLIVASVERHDEALQYMAGEGMPIVTVNRRSDDPAIPSVVGDEDEGIRQVVEHLIGLGHRRFAAIAGPQALSTGKDRHEAVVNLLGERPEAVELTGVAFAAAFNEEEGENCMQELLDARTSFTAAVVANDRLAIGAIAALKRSGLDCPGDVSVTGYNDMPLVDRLDPPLTTVRILQYQSGFRAAEMLMGIVDGGMGSAAEHVVLPVELVVRGSTAPPSA